MITNFLGEGGLLQGSPFFSVPNQAHLPRGINYPPMLYSDTLFIFLRLTVTLGWEITQYGYCFNTIPLEHLHVMAVGGHVNN